MTKRRVLLFGGSGFVGRHVASCLTQHGWAVRIASRHPGQPDPAEAGKAVEVTSADLRNEDQVRAAVADSEAVVNLVGIGREKGQSFDVIHVEGAERIAQLAAAAGVMRLLHVSALGVAEDVPSAADRTKAEGESVVRAAFPAATIVRPSLIYGPGDHFFSRFAAVARVSPVVPVIGGGRTRFQPLYIEDAAQSFRALLERPETAGMTLALVGSETFTFRQLIERMLEVQGQRRLILSLPFPLAERLAAVLERLPVAPLTREEVWLLQTDKVAGRLPTAADLGIVARPLQEGLRTTLRAAA
jgi:NADH dehydrogenase